LQKKTYKKYENDAKNVQMWVTENKETIFLNLHGSNMPFTNGIQTKWQKEMMLYHGHESGVSIDATFGTNDKKVTIFFNFRDTLL
jgi:hypothetical protein